MNKKQQEILAYIAIGIWSLLALWALFLNYGEVIERWQTLIAGILALAAAAWTAILINKQILQSEKQEQNRVQRRLVAARATLPLALSGICNYAKDVCSELKLIYPFTETAGVKFGIPTFTITPVPVSLISDLERMIEATTSPSVANRIADIICEIQTLNARTHDLDEKLHSPSYVGKRESVTNYLIQSAELLSLAESLFKYARRRSDEVGDFDSDTVHAAFVHLGLDTAGFGEVVDEFIRRTAK